MRASRARRPASRRGCSTRSKGTVSAMTLIQLLCALIFAVGVQDHQHDLNRRGEAVMGFDQATTTHHFRITPDGGAIEVTANEAGDTASIDAIRMHLQHIAKMFAAGDFTAPMLIHAKEPPGVITMKQAGSKVR